ncbi:MAG: biotin--[acetyl-CoA-carboxylase] ligase [Hominenteromicrobium sp.]|uniref:biotin--[acetyl-CoA-carboxylase] ligase n=1 Tax=Hominenteromicrobium sp. TaxID=3073581 RepID=UPI0039A0B70A
MAIPTKQALLQALSGAEGRYISGEQLAQTLGVSRAAIHKAAAALTAQGYTLEAAPAGAIGCWAGTRSVPTPWASTPHRFMSTSGWTAATRQPSGWHWPGPRMARWCWRASRDAGRGRMGRRFESPAGKGIYLSLVLRVPVPASEALGVTVGAAVAVARAVQKLCGIELGIKWVNDLYYQGKKVCGILTEAGTSVESGLLEWLVVGIGLNLTTTPADWPEELARTAGSLFPGGPAPVGRAALARGHCPGAADPLPGLRLPGRVPLPLLCAGALGHRLHRRRDLRGPGHRH